jgi:hypothetical protein
MTSASGRRFGPVVKGALVLVLVGLAAVVGFQLGERTLQTSPTPPVAASPVTVVAAQGTLVDERRMSVEAEWPRVGRVLNRLAGTVTTPSSVPVGETVVVDAGAVLFSVNELPVVAMQGEVAAYRSLAPGAAGTDVRQLQEFLVAAGYRVDAIDGRWRQDTTVAYRQWRADRLLPARSVIALGEIVFIPSLPLTVTPAEGLVAGGVIGDGDVAFEVLAALPTLRLSLGSDASFQVPVATRVDIDVAGEVVSTTATERQSVSDAGERLADLALVAVAGCGQWCGSLPTIGVSSWPAVVRLKGPETGVVLPVGAIRSGVGSGTVVVKQDGSSVPVEVVLQVGGDAIVMGVSAGDVVVLPGTSAGAVG